MLSLSSIIMFFAIKMQERLKLENSSCVLNDKTIHESDGHKWRELSKLWLEKWSFFDIFEELSEFIV